jgi:hypothetical protein
VKRCLVLGAALCLFDDIEAALSLAPVDGVVAVKGAGKVWRGELDAWVGLHPEMILADYKVREARGYPRAKQMFVHEGASIPSPLFDRHMEYRFPGQTSSGSSGLFGVKVARELGLIASCCAASLLCERQER